MFPLPGESLNVEDLSIVLIGPHELRREEIAFALARCGGSQVHAFSSYPPSLDDVPRLLEQHHDVIIIDLDCDPEYALDLVESIGANGSVTVMVYSAKTDSGLLVRCMRAGAREFLTLPLEPGLMAESLVRAAARRPVATAVAPSTEEDEREAAGISWAPRAATGVTTLACNFAVALAAGNRTEDAADRSRSSARRRGARTWASLRSFRRSMPCSSQNG